MSEVSGTLFAIGAVILLGQSAVLLICYRWVLGRFAAVTDHWSFRAFSGTYAAGATLMSVGLFVGVVAVLRPFGGTAGAVLAVQTGTRFWLAGLAVFVASFLAARWMHRENQRRGD